MCPRTILQHRSPFGAKLPFRVLQFCGFFPLSIKTYRLKNSSTIEIVKNPWFLCPSTIWIITLLFTTISHVLFGFFLDPERYTRPSRNRNGSGPRTYIIINIIWNTSLILCPTLTRINLLYSWREKFVSFWDSYSDLISKCQEILQDFNLYETRHCKVVRYKFVFHFLAQMCITCAASWAVSTSTAADNQRSVLDIFQTVLTLFSGICIAFALHGHIYIVTTYAFSMSRLVEEIQNIRSFSNENCLKLEPLIALYFHLEESVHGFCSINGTILNIYVMHTFVYILFCSYFILNFFILLNYPLLFCTISQLTVFTLYFYWLVNSASELHEQSNTFCRLMKSVWFNFNHGATSPLNKSTIQKIKLQRVSYVQKIPPMHTYSCQENIQIYKHIIFV